MGRSFRTASKESGQVPSYYQMEGNFYDATAAFAAAASATDIFTIQGAAGKAINIIHVSMSGTQTTSGAAAIYFLRRSTANSGGTETAITVIPVVSTSPAAYATVKAYTANPTVGTLAGNVQIRRAHFSAATGSPPAIEPLMIDGMPLATILEGETFAINLNGVTFSGNSLACHVRWQEVSIA